jgi:hypothetical protein
MSCSFRGEEIDINEALDELFHEIQSNLNNCQCQIRGLAQSEERNDTFIESSRYDFAIQDYVMTLIGLFKELKAVSKSALGKIPAEHRDEYAKLIEKRKLNAGINNMTI